MKPVLELTKDEEHQLAKCEAVISIGRRHFLEVAEALVKIKEGKLYRKKYATFDEYCEDKWKFSASRARQLIGAIDTVENVKSVTIVTPETESQARALSCLDPEEQKEVWKEAVKEAGGKQPTVKQIDAAADRVVPPKNEDHELADGMRRIAATKDLKSLQSKIWLHAETWPDDASVTALLHELRKTLIEIEAEKQKDDPENVVKMEARG